MECNCNNNNSNGGVIPWVRGNRLPLIICVYENVVTQEQVGDSTLTVNEMTRVPYTIQDNDTVTVIMKSGFRQVEMPFTTDGNKVMVTDNGELPTGAYTVEVTIERGDGARGRWQETRQVRIYENTSDAQLGEMYSIDADLFFYAKGDTGTGIADITNNPDGTLTIAMTDGTSYTTEALKGDKGDKGDTGERGVSIVSFDVTGQTDVSVIYTVTFSDDTTQDISVPKGPQGDTGLTGNGISSTTLNSDYTLTIAYTDGTTYTTPSIRGAQGAQGVSVIGFTQTGETATNTMYNLVFSDGRTQSVAIPKGVKGDKGDKGDTGATGATGAQGPKGDTVIIGDEQTYTLYGVTGQNSDGAMTQKAVTDALVANAISYDNSQSGLVSNNVQGALDEVTQNVDEIENKFITSELYVSKLSQAIASKSAQYLSTSLGLIAGQTYRVVIELSTTATSSMAFYLRSVATSSTPRVTLADVAIGDKTIEVSYTPSTSTNYQYLAWYSNESTSNSFDIYFYIDEEIENVAPAFTAEGTSYDNNNSKLSATNVQEALDEVSEEYKLVVDTGYNPLGKGMANSYVALQDWVNVTLDNHSITLTIANEQTSAYTQGPTCTILKNGKTYRIEFDYETDFNTQIRTMFADLTVQNDIVLKSFSGSGHAIINHTMPYDSGGFAFLIPANTGVGETISITNFFVYEESNVKDVLTEVVKEKFEGEKSLSILSNITKPCELAQVGAYGMYINTNTYVWTNNANNTSCYVYKVIGGTSVKISTNSTTRVQYTFLTNIDAVAGNLADFADGWNKRIAAMVVDETVTVDVPNDAKYIYMLSLPPTCGAPKRIDGIVGDGINAVDFVGDSLTATGLRLTSPMAYFPSKVREYLGIDGFNMGIAGENAGTILGRCNGIPYKLASNVTIPSDTTNVQIYITNIYGQHLLPLLHRYTSYTVVIDGIEGTLTTTQTNVGAANADYFFQRKVSGTAYNAKAGDDIFVQDFKATLNPHRAKIIWVGQNGGFDTNSTSRWGGNINNADDRARLIDMINTYIDVSGCEYYMVLSAPQNTNNDLESDFTKAFGNRYFNVRMYMVNHGIDDAIALGYLSASSYPTAQDITDMNNGVVPSSLRIDSVHFTQNGFYTLAYALSTKLKEVWNL